MTPIFKFEGIYTPVITPYHQDGGVNWDALAEVIDTLKQIALKCRCDSPL